MITIDCVIARIDGTVREVIMINYETRSAYYDVLILPDNSLQYERNMQPADISKTHGGKMAKTKLDSVVTALGELPVKFFEAKKNTEPNSVIHEIWANIQSALNALN